MTVYLLAGISLFELHGLIRASVEVPDTAIDWYTVSLGTSSVMTTTLNQAPTEGTPAFTGSIDEVISDMPKYVLLVNWTEKGVADATNTVQRAGQVRQLVEKHGGRQELLLWTLGRHDVVGVYDLPDDETMAAISMQVSGQGAVRTETLRAFTADELGSVLNKLG